MDELKLPTELLKFVAENHKAGRLSKKLSDNILALWNEYKLTEITSGCSIIESDFGTLGSVVIRQVDSVDKAQSLKYESGSYDYVSIVAKPTQYILWTDFSETEPYNRQSGLYCSGMSWKILGEPVVVKSDYREFQYLANYSSNICFGVWGYNYNSFYGCVRFGLCIKNEDVETFMRKLRAIIGK